MTYRRNVSPAYKSLFSSGSYSGERDDSPKRLSDLIEVEDEGSVDITIEKQPDENKLETIDVNDQSLDENIQYSKVLKRP